MHEELQDLFDLYFWFVATNRPMHADNLLDQIEPRDVDAFCLATYTVFELAARSNLNAYTYLVLSRSLLCRSTKRLEKRINQAVILEYCWRMDDGLEELAKKVLELGTSKISEELSVFLIGCKASEKLVSQAITLLGA